MKKPFMWLATTTLSLVLFFACTENTNESADKDTKLIPDTEDTYTAEETAALDLTAEVTTMGQQTLMASLVQAIEDSGTAGAVVFCNIHVGGIYDSLKKTYGVEVSRVSHKNRNPANAANDREVKLITEYGANNKTHAPALFDDGDHYTAYKPISMSILACSKCHGTPGAEIEQPTLITISMLYPNDKATGFKYKDIRGLWKIEIPKAAL